MAKPTKSPNWMSDANLVDPDKTVEPSAGKRAAGWSEEEKPPAEFLNHMFGYIWRWLAYLISHISDENTTTISLDAGTADTSWEFVPGYGVWESAVDPGTVVIGVPIQAGIRIKKIKFYVRDGSGLTLIGRASRLTTLTNGAHPTDPWEAVGVESAGDATEQVLELDVDYTTVAGEKWNISIEGDVDGNNTGMQWRGAEIVWDRP